MFNDHADRKSPKDRVGGFPSKKLINFRLISTTFCALGSGEGLRGSKGCKVGPAYVGVKREMPR